MDKQFAKHMIYGKYVKNTVTDDMYKLIEDMNAEKETVRVVNLSNYKRYDLLGTWIRNYESDSFGFRDRFTGNIDDYVTERKSYEEEQKIADVIPQNKIPFITPDYKTLFTVTELDFVEFDTVDGETELRRVIADDCETNGFNACHFHFENGSVYHICEFAGKVNPNGDRVRPVNNKTSK